MKDTAIVIVGAGPAGLGAAVRIAESGVTCTVLDENTRVGGVIYRGPARSPARSPGRAQAQSTVFHGKSAQARDALFAALARHRERIQLRLGTQVVGPLGEGARRLGLLADGHLQSVSFDRLLVCTGCYERSIPFPGWTLPGVMTVGGMQLQIKSGLVRPGRRAVLCGTGPLLLLAGKELHQAGVEVVGVFESGRRRHLLPHVLSLARSVELVREGAALMRYLRKAGIPLHYGWGIVAAHGEDELRSVTVAPYDGQWRPVRARAREIEADCLGVEYGFVARAELTRLFGVEHDHQPAIGVYPVTDEWGRASRRDIYVAGDNTGSNGAYAALEAGRLAALGCLLDSGYMSADEAESLARPVRARLRKWRAFRAAFDRFSELRPGLVELPDDDTIICRCEHVSRGAIDRAIARGTSDMTTLKMMTRLGMGDCQGKVCASYTRDYLQTKVGRSDVGFLRPRFPLAPVPFRALAEYEAES